MNSSSSSSSMQDHSDHPPQHQAQEQSLRPPQRRLEAHYNATAQVALPVMLDDDLSSSSCALVSSSIISQEQQGKHEGVVHVNGIHQHLHLRCRQDDNNNNNKMIAGARDHAEEEEEEEEEEEGEKWYDASECSSFFLDEHTSSDDDVHADDHISTRGALHLDGPTSSVDDCQNHIDCEYSPILTPITDEDRHPSKNENSAGGNSLHQDDNQSSDSQSDDHDDNDDGRRSTSSRRSSRSTTSSSTSSEVPTTTCTENQNLLINGTTEPLRPVEPLRSSHNSEQQQQQQQQQQPLSPTHALSAACPQEQSVQVTGASHELTAQRRIEQMKVRWGSTTSRKAASLGNFSNESSSSSSSSDDDDDDDASSSSSSSSSNNNSSSSSDEDDGEGATVNPRVNLVNDRSRAALMARARSPNDPRLYALLAFKEASKSVRSGMTQKEGFNFKSIVRKSRRIDMETGVLSAREFTAHRISDPEYWTAMNPNERRKRMFLRKTKQSLDTELNASRSGSKNKLGNLNNNNISYKKRSLWSVGKEEEEEPLQYRLVSMIEKNDYFTFSGDRYHLTREYLYWALRKTFMSVVLTETIVFLAWSMSFAVLYYIFGKRYPQCILSMDGRNFEEANMGMVDAFTLSWATFSTVGYGSVYPAIRGAGASPQCVFVTTLASLQSFVGVLYASFCSAIIFAKIARTQAIAHVIFSDTVVIRYGEELMQSEESPRNKNRHKRRHRHSNDEKSAGSSGHLSPRHKGILKSSSFASNISSTRKIKLYPCPILEFRVVNLLHSEKGGEIMNCKLNVVASTVDEVTNFNSKTRKSSLRPVSKVGMQVLKTIKGVKKRVAVKAFDLDRSDGSVIQKVNRSIAHYAAQYNAHRAGTNNDAEAVPFKENEHDGSVRSFDPLAPDDRSEDVQNLVSKDKMSRSFSLFVDEEPGGDETKSSRRVFSKVELETDSHPFFKRVWNLRHRLDEESPLLTEEGRDVLRMNGGFWPASLCNARYIEKCLEKSQLIVTVSGTAVVSGSSVYKLHVYEANCFEIGRTFENPLAFGKDRKLTVDMNLVSSTKPQYEEHYDSDVDD